MVRWRGKSSQLLKPNHILFRGIMKLLKENEVAEKLQVSVPKLRLDRVKNRGIPYFKIGNLCRYNIDQVIKHLEDNQYPK